MSEQVIIAIISAIVTIVTTIVTGIITWLKAQQAVTKSEENAGNIDKVHTIVNSQRTVMMEQIEHLRTAQVQQDQYIENLKALITELKGVNQAVITHDIGISVK